MTILRGISIGLVAFWASSATMLSAQAQTTERVSVDSAGNQGNRFSGRTFLSTDGRFVLFNSSSNNLVAGDTNGFMDVFVHDRQTGVTERVSVDSAGNQGNFRSFRPSISADGWIVAFDSQSSNLVAGDTNNRFDVFVHDRQTGVTERVSVDSAGSQGNGNSLTSSISADGRFVAFTSFATNLVAGDTNGFFDIFVHDRQTGVLDSLFKCDTEVCGECLDRCLVAETFARG